MEQRQRNDRAIYRLWPNNKHASQPLDLRVMLSEVARQLDEDGVFNLMILLDGIPPGKNHLIVSVLRQYCKDNWTT